MPKTKEELMADWVELVNTQLAQQLKFNETLIMEINILKGILEGKAK